MSAAGIRTSHMIAAVILFYWNIALWMMKEGYQCLRVVTAMKKVQNITQEQ
jgi:hypothetical protein